jgi:hypothetical protein
MLTQRSFLAFAAAAQLAGPLAGPMAVRGKHQGGRSRVRLPELQLRTGEGRDIHFHNDLATGQLSILDLRYAAGPAIGMAGAAIVQGARQAAGSRDAHDFYLYSVTRQAAFDKAADLQRYMDWYAAAAGGTLPAAAQHVEVLRLRFGVYEGG